MSVFSPLQWQGLARRARALTPARLRAPRTLWTVAGVCLFAGLVAQLAAPAGLTGAAGLLREGAVVAGFVAAWFAARFYFERRPSAPMQALGWPVLAVVGLLLVAAIPWSLGLASVEMSPAAGVLVHHLLVLPEMAFTFFLLLQLRRLVLYRRTRRSQGRWRLMLVLMCVTALAAFGREPGAGLGALQVIPLIAAVALMVANSFRLSWIIGLSMREKVACAALSLALLVAASVALSLMNNELPSGARGGLAAYSYTLDLFAIQVCTFGILYSLTALLSLIFHLPTTGDVKRKSDETAALHALAHLVDQTFDPERLSESIAAAPVKAGSSDAAWLALDGASEQLIQGRATEGPQVVAAAGQAACRLEEQVDLDALFDEVRRTHAPLVLDDVHSDARARDEAEGELASLLVVPLVARGVFVGALMAARDVTRGFEVDDISSIQAFASQAGLALDHARLFEEQLEMERLERELDIARRVQQRLLPRRLPEVEGLELAAGSTPAREVGGDYYDFACLDDGRLAFIVADVSGKGTQAAFFMAEMQGLFRSLSRIEPAPKAFLTRANETLRGILDEGTFISALYGVLDPERCTLELARAGHCPVALVRKEEAPCLLRPDGLGLGMAPTPLFARTLAPERLRLCPGDALALYTDGLVESRSGDGEEYGYDRLLDSLRRHEGRSPTALHDELLADLRAFTASDVYDDDLTLVVLRWRCTDAPGVAPPADEPAAPRTLSASLPPVSS